MKEYPVCSTCGSQDILKDAFAYWDYEAQSWELQATFDNTICQDCDGETSLEWKKDDA